MSSPAVPPLDPFYYLDNFTLALDWVAQRYDHLLDDEERRFATLFPTLPQASRALVVRMAMRKGSLFRTSKLRYAEIGAACDAVEPLVAVGWVDARPLLELDQLFALLTKGELSRAFALSSSEAGAAKAVLHEQLRAQHAKARCLDDWWPGCDDQVLRLLVDPLCNRLRLLFFGNGWQDWSEFVLADLGIYRYEQVELGINAHGFRSRADVDCYLQLQQCRECLEDGAPAHEILASVPPPIADNAWLESRRAKLLFALAQQQERATDWAGALDIYARCSYAGARQRRIRMLERLERFDEAWHLASAAVAMPESEAERQQLQRMLPRLRRRLGLPQEAVRATVAPQRIDLVLPQPDGDYRVELLAAQALADEHAPVVYVENALLTSLFGLLCWPAVFAPVPGAFFHPFQSGPADLGSPDFHVRREALFAQCLAQLDDGRYRDTIYRHYREKLGIVSPFVAWDLLEPELLELALDCLPPAHLKACFTRMLFDVKSNCAGLPDLIQFYPAEKGYRLIEVKGPGDRLQDNQLRWLEHFAAHGIPVAVCYVRWQEDQ